MDSQDENAAFGNAVGILQRGLGYIAAPFALVNGIVALKDFYRFEIRVLVWCVTIAMFVLAAWVRPKPRRRAGFAPVGDSPTATRNLRWLWGAAIFGIALIADVGTHFFIPRDPLLSNVQFLGYGIGDAPISEPDDLSLPRIGEWPYILLRTDDQVRLGPDQKASDRDSDFSQWLGVPLADQVALVKDRARIQLDNVDKQGPMDEEAAGFLYQGWLGEHFGFRVAKAVDVPQLWIADVEIEVTKYISCLPGPASAGAPAPLEHPKVIVVELARKSAAPPWTFSAKYVLDDAESRAVHPWGRVRMPVSDKGEDQVFVKIASRDSGIFVYSASLVLEGQSGARRKIRLTEKPRSVFFEHYGEAAESIFDFWENVQPELGKSVGTRDASSPEVAPNPDKGSSAPTPP